MSLKDRATAPPEVNRGMACPLRNLLDTLPTAEAKALATMLDAPWRVWPHSEIEKALRDEGMRVGTGAVGKHRRLTCKCGKS